LLPGRPVQAPYLRCPAIAVRDHPYAASLPISESQNTSPDGGFDCLWRKISQLRERAMLGECSFVKDRQARLLARPLRAGSGRRGRNWR
jgi:hypothetical protein